MATPAASPLTSFFSLFTTAICPNTLQWHNFLQRLRNMVPHKTECSGYTQMVQLVTILNAWGSPLFHSNPASQIRCANSLRDDTAHTISAATDSQQSLHPTRTFTGCPLRRMWLRSISHADRMQKSHAAQSRFHHRTFVTKVNICAQLIIPAVRFASFPASVTPAVSEAALGVCVHGNTRAGIVFRFGCTKI